MKKKKNKIFLYFISIILISLLFYFVINDKEKNNFILNNFKDLSASISNISSFSFKKNNNNELIKEINNDYQREINNLKETLDLNSLNSNKKFVNATVVKRSINYWYNIITIDKGKKNNLKVGQAVINNNGLIGKIIKVNNYSSDIKLIISSNDGNYVSAKFNYENKDYYGLISSYDYKKNELILKNVIGDFTKEKIIGINVVTSGLSDSFTSGLLIGQIKEINKDSFGISNEIIITPSVNFDNLNIVSVVVGDR